MSAKRDHDGDVEMETPFKRIQRGKSHRRDDYGGRSTQGPDGIDDYVPRHDPKQHRRRERRGPDRYVPRDSQQPNRRERRAPDSYIPQNSQQQPNRRERRRYAHGVQVSPELVVSNEKAQHQDIIQPQEGDRPKKRFDFEDDLVDGGRAYSQARRDARKAFIKHSFANGAGARKIPSLNICKSKIRDLIRLLQHAEHMPADVRIEKERELAGWKRDQEENVQRKERKQMIEKYHFVRFIGKSQHNTHFVYRKELIWRTERQKCTRNLKALLKEQTTLSEFTSTSPSEQPSLELLTEKIHDARIDLNYTLYSPLTEKYIALFPNTSNAAPSTTGAKPRKEEEVDNILRNNSGEKPPGWYAVEQSMRDGTLEQLRDGKLSKTLAGEDKAQGFTMNVPIQSKHGTKKGDGVSLTTSPGRDGSLCGREKLKSYGWSVQGGVQVDVEMDGKDSDGGFFE